jgi:hypothetical protein
MSFIPSIKDAPTCQVFSEWMTWAFA